MSDKSRTLFVRLDKNEADQVKALSKEFGLPMEEILRRMVVHSLSELEAEDLPAGERQRMAYDEAVREIEQRWRPDF